jgi:hypothetical protein
MAVADNKALLRQILLAQSSQYHGGGLVAVVFEDVRVVEFPGDCFHGFSPFLFAVFVLVSFGALSPLDAYIVAYFAMR